MPRRSDAIARPRTAVVVGGGIAGLATATLRNLATAINAGGDVLVRIPVIPGVNNQLDDAVAFCQLLEQIGVHEVQLLPFHQFGERKYELLDWRYQFAGVPALHEDDLTDYRATFCEHGVRAFF